MQNSKCNMDFVQSILSLIFVVIVSLSSFLVIRPFILMLTWSSMMVIITWPLMLKLQHFLGGRRSIAIMTLMIALLFFFIFPVFLVIHSLVDSSVPLLNWLTSNTVEFPELIWLQEIPIIGKKIFLNYQDLLDNENNELFHNLTFYIARTAEFFFIQAKHLGLFVIQFIFMFLFSILLYWNGEKITCAVRDFARRVNSENGEAIVALSVEAIRAVALGVLVTSIIQAIFSGIGLFVVGIPCWTLIMVLVIFSCLFQLGPMPILIPSIAWLFWKNCPAWGTSLLIWSLFLCVLDNIIRSLLIRMGADLPILLILFGVIGGLIAFGVIGLFIGPVVLIISYRLLISWMYGIPIPSAVKKEWIKKIK